MTAAMISRISLGLALLMTAVNSPAESSLNDSSVKRASVHVFVVSTAGVRLDGASVILKGPRGNITWIESSKPNVVPYGDYQMEVTKAGFYSAARRINVDKPVVWVTVGLALGMDRARMHVDFAGIITGADEGANVWVKLVSLYSDLTITTAVDPRGRFYLPVPYSSSGRALLLVFVGSELRGTREVMVRDDEPEIKVELGRRHSQ